MKVLEIEGIEAFYGSSQALFGMTLEVAAGEVVTLLGRNGMGKTTTVRAVMGILAPSAGAIRFAGRPIHGLPAYRVAQAGLGLVPEGRQPGFPSSRLRWMSADMRHRISFVGCLTVPASSGAFRTRDGPRWAWARRGKYPVGTV